MKTLLKQVVLEQRHKKGEGAKHIDMWEEHSRQREKNPLRGFPGLFENHPGGLCDQSRAKQGEGVGAKSRV